MATPNFFRRQAAASAILAKQTHDDESRQRCLRLEQAFLHLAKTEEQFDGGASSPHGDSETKLAD